MRKSGYEIFTRNLEDLVEGQEQEFEIRDCATYQPRAVRGILSRSAEKLPGGEPIWIRALVGHLLDPKPWAIKITQVVEEAETETKS